MANPYPIEIGDADGVARLQGEATFTDPANQPGGTHIATASLTNAQIKALPTAPYALVAAPGAGKIILPLFAYLVAKTTAGAYTNIDVAAGLGIEAVGTPDAGAVLTALQEANAASGTVSDLLAFGGVCPALLGPNITNAAVAVSQLFGNTNVFDALTAVNTPLLLSLPNGGAGNLTGGHATNYLKVMVVYAVATVPA